MEITAAIELQSNTSCDINISIKPAGQVLVKYENIDFKLYPTLSITSSSEVSIVMITVDELYKAVKTNYELINGISFSFDINISTVITNELKETSKPTLTVNSDYEIYTLKITADISASSNVDLVFDFAEKTNVSTKANYLLEDYPNLIKIQIGTEIKSSLSITSVSSSDSIMVLDPDLKLLTYIDDLEYFSWTRRWRRPDSFEIKINRYKENAEYLKVNNYLVKKTGDLLRGGRIRNREIKVDENGRSSEKLEVKGRGFGNIFNQRIALNGINQTDGFDTIEASAETVMKYYVDVNVVNPVDDKRKIPNLKIEEDKGLGKIVKYKARFQKLSDILYDISHISGLGWDIKFDLDNRKFIFQVLYAELKPEIKLSTNTDSVKRIKFKEKHLDSINTAVVAGQGEGPDRLVVKVTEDDL